MRFEWDEEKRISNLRKHEIDFADLIELFENHNNYTVIDERFDYGEIRYITIGIVNGEVIAVAHTETDDLIRIISARKADKRDEQRYFEEFGN